ncbi:MAG: RDD family protein [Gammaproteobacteria bacterium]|nr:RDD family protein [Gammaproteobacteria bacterium]
MNADLPGAAFQYAGFWRRVAATLIDSFLFAIIIGLLMGSVIMDAELFTGEGLLRTMTGFLLTIILWVKFLGTPGKLLLDCQVVDADSFKPMSIKQAALRYVAYLASILPLFLGFLWIARDKRKQAFHDKIANTVVLHKADIEADDESKKSLEQLMGELR